MKKILITGKNSYVGKNFQNWLGHYPDRYSIDSISLRDESWKDTEFSGYDVVFHVAGIAHKKETKENADLYYRVNRDLAYEVAQKAKNESVKQFIFLSSMSVYGIESGVIDKDSPLNPKNNYGKSKLQAEEIIKSLESTEFGVAIIRPPMIYGKGCKGNYPRIAKLALRVPVFPSLENKRSMIYIENLCEFSRLIIDHNSAGVFFPQNAEYVCTKEMVRLIAELHASNIRMTRLFNFFLKIVRVRLVKKVFGDLVYEKRMSEFKTKYCVADFKTSIVLTEEISD
ncbi:NAD-dependent epimerase/dehydratase family protein [Radiobacillus deserti]|uniref:NAD-dependent epimerase/dehydratase family protein n=1 Tax=Radiobacillus deserti TaxID=2594883 RepID=A0A516KJ87_9BACI|nr:NAD-dependent epimerase/dehydratase family protein [Radiobacillus deserti]QDP41460.1 NAD-dependent epimerase/dehydratase family protein [Radiobacillus deserti]